MACAGASSGPRPACHCHRRRRRRQRETPRNEEDAPIVRVLFDELQRRLAFLTKHVLQRSCILSILTCCYGFHR